MLQIITSLLLPGLILVAGIYGYHATENMLLPQQNMLGWLPLIIALMMLALCLRFNRSRMFFAALSTTLAYVILHWYIPVADALVADIVWAALSLLLPLNFVVFSLFKERGILTWWGSSRFAFLLLPMLLVYLVAQIYPVSLQKLLATQIIAQEVITVIAIYQGPLLIICIALLILNGKVFVETTAQNSSLFMALLTSVMMLHYWDESSARAVFASTALLMMAIAVIHDSWSMAYIDQLTNLPGRRALEEEMLKLGSNYSIAMIDIDHFKKFNDQHGHDAGDQVLNMVASRLKHTGGGGKAFRYGGEEFTILFSGKKVSETLNVLEELRHGIAATSFRLRNRDRRKGSKKRKTAGKSVSVTISIGVAGRGEKIQKAHDIIKRADKALYRAKKQGRNRVCK